MTNDDMRKLKDTLVKILVDNKIELLSKNIDILLIETTVGQPQGKNR